MRRLNSLHGKGKGCFKMKSGGLQESYVGASAPQRSVLACVAILLSWVAVPTFAGLYKPTAPLTILNATNFHDVLTNKSNAWIVEFYVSWCGYCQRFAPVFLAFAEDIEGWKPILSLAALDCSDEHNVDLCRSYNVTTYPTLMFLWPWATAKDGGLRFTRSETSEGMRHIAIGLLQGNQSKHVPRKPDFWPSLDPLPDNASLSQLWSQVPSAVNKLILVVDANDSYVGREITPHLNANPKVRVYRVLYRVPPGGILRELPEPKESGKRWSEALATVYTATRGGSAALLLSLNRGKDYWPLVKEVLKPYHGVEATTQMFTKAVTTPAVPVADPSKVYQADLNNALVYALRQEVAVHSTLNQSEIQALSSFVNILYQFFPGDDAIMRFLGDLMKFLCSPQSNERGGLRGKAISNFLDSHSSVSASADVE